MTQLKKIAFLDRDGVINKKAAPHEYVCSVGEFVFNPGIFPLLQKLAGNSYEFIVLTNQRGIARGKLTEQTLTNIHEYMRIELQKQQIVILDILHCPHEKDSCECRKPKPGLLEIAVKKYPIDLSNSVFISDSQADVEMGKQFGIGRNILIAADQPQQASLNF